MLWNPGFHQVDSWGISSPADCQNACADLQADWATYGPGYCHCNTECVDTFPSGHAIYQQLAAPTMEPTTPSPTPSPTMKPTTKEPTPSPTMKPTTTTQALIEQLSSDVGVLQDQLSSLPDKRRERTPCQQKQNLSWKYEIADRKCEIKKLKKAQKGKIATCLGRDARKERLLARLQTLESDQVADLSTCQV